jgi:hypothetical protein
MEIVMVLGTLHKFSVVWEHLRQKGAENESLEGEIEIYIAEDCVWRQSTGDLLNTPNFEHRRGRNELFFAFINRNCFVYANSVERTRKGKIDAEGEKLMKIWRCFKLPIKLSANYRWN